MRKLIRFILNTIPRPWLIRFSYIFRLISRVFYKGTKYECPVCGGKFRKFLPYGYVQVRNNAMCPGCLALERHRIMWLYLQQKTDFFTASKKVLHVAPEQCFIHKFRKLKNLDYSTADLESPLADYKCDVQNMPFDKNTFDILICNHVLEHVPDFHLALSEILRVIKPGGYAILQVPADFDREKIFEDNSITDKAQRTEIFGQYDHLRVFGLDYPEILKRAGFIIDEPNFTDLITVEEKTRYGVNSREFMFSAKKPSE